VNDGQGDFYGKDRAPGATLFPNIHGLNIFPDDEEKLRVLASSCDGMNWEKWREIKYVNVVFIRPIGNICSEGLRDIAECICEGFCSLGYSAELSENKFSENCINFIIGWQLLGEINLDIIPTNSIIYNLEQLGEKNSFYINQLVELSKHIDVWDYSQKNIDILMSSGVARIPRLLKIGTSKSMNRIAKPDVQDIDVLFYGTMNDRRADILAQLKDAGLNVVNLFGVYGEERDSYIARAKIVLNVHFYLMYIFETVRVSYLMANRKAVVAECNDATEVDADLLSGIKAVDYKNLVPACLELLRDENARAILEENAQKTINTRRQEDAIFDALLPCNPSVSIIVPTQNRPGFLPRAINSIARQTYKDYEIIVTQDGGEGVGGIISDARSQGLPVRLVASAESKGPSHARNLALNVSRGRWIAYLDDDDLYYPDHLQTLVEALENSNMKIAYTNSNYAMEVFENQQWIVKSRELAMSREFKDGVLLYDNITPPINVMHARSCYEIVGGFDESLIVCEDWEYWLRLSQCWDFLHINKVTAELRWRITQNDNATFNRSHLFPIARSIIFKRYSFIPPQEAFLLEMDKSPKWKDFMTAFLLSFLPHEQIVLIIVKNSGSANSRSDDDIKEHLRNIIDRTGFVRFSPIWIIDNPMDVMDVQSQFVAIYPLVKHSTLDCQKEIPKRLNAALKNFTNYFNANDNREAVSISSPIHNTNKHDSVAWLSAEDDLTAVSSVSSIQDSDGRDSVALLIPIYKPQIAGLELFSLQHSLNVLKPERQVHLICPHSFDYSFYTNLFPNASIVAFNDSFFQSVGSYSRLLLNEFFYDSFKNYEFVLISQTDAILLRDELDYWCDSGYDYIGAPWPNSLKITVNTDKYKDLDRRVSCPVGNGGLSLRRVAKCIQLIKEFPEASTKFAGNRINEDLFFSIFGTLSDNFSVPDRITASRFSMEISPDYFSFLNSGKAPMGGHAWWKYDVHFWLNLLGSAADPIREEAIRQYEIEQEKIKLQEKQLQKAGQNPPF